MNREQHIALQHIAFCFVRVNTIFKIKLIEKNGYKHSRSFQGKQLKESLIVLRWYKFLKSDQETFSKDETSKLLILSL